MGLSRISWSVQLPKNDRILENASSRRSLLLTVMSTQVTGFEELKKQYQVDPYLSSILDDLQG